MADELARPARLEGAPVFKFDASLTTQDIVDLGVVEREEQLLTDREYLEGEVRKAEREHGRATARLTELAEALVGAYKDDGKAQALIDAWAAFKDESPSDYKIVAEQGSVDVEKSMVTATLVVSRASASTSSYGYYSNVAARSMELPFTPQMRAQVAVIEEAAGKVEEVRTKLNSVRRKIADLPRHSRRIKAAIVREQLSGRLRDGNELLQAIMGVEPKALPSM